MNEQKYNRLLNEAKEAGEFTTFLHEAREYYFKPASDEPFSPFLMSLSDDKARVYLALALETIFEQEMNG